MQTTRHSVSKLVVLLLCLLLPALSGGCPEFRNEAVNAVDAATRSILLADTEPREALDTATTGIFNAALSLLFDQFRSDEAL